MRGIAPLKPGYSLIASRSSRKSPSTVITTPNIVNNSPIPSNALPAITGLNKMQVLLSRNHASLLIYMPINIMRE